MSFLSNIIGSGDGEGTIDKTLLLDLIDMIFRILKSILGIDIGAQAEEVAALD